MVKLSGGLIVTEQLTQRQVSLDLHFEPSVGILARKVDKLGIDIRSFRAPLRRAIKFVMIPSIRRNFDEGGRPAWQPLAEETILRKRSEHPLIASGSLRRVMGYINTWHIDSEKAMITDLPSRVWYGKVHQAGWGQAEMFRDPVTGRNVNVGDVGAIPARPFAVVQSEDIDNIERIFDEWLAERMIKAGLGRG
jgi:phage gpG-like protein